MHASSDSNLFQYINKKVQLRNDLENKSHIKSLLGIPLTYDGHFYVRCIIRHRDGIPQILFSAASANGKEETEPSEDMRIFVESIVDRLQSDYIILQFPPLVMIEDDLLLIPQDGWKYFEAYPSED